MTGQRALCAAPVQLALPRASVDAELAAAIRKYRGLRWVPFNEIARIIFRDPDETLAITVRRPTPW